MNAKKKLSLLNEILKGDSNASIADTVRRAKQRLEVTFTEYRFACEVQVRPALAHAGNQVKTELEMAI